MYKNKKAFGLVDMLISLLVISFGYILVIQPLLNYSKPAKGEKSQNPVQQSYGYAKQDLQQTLTQATMLMAGQNSGTIQGLCSDSYCLGEMYAARLSIMRVCGISDVKSCWHENIPNAFSMIMSNGTLFLIYNDDSACTNNICAKIKVDVNGFKEPNQQGIDIFETTVGQNTIGELQ